MVANSTTVYENKDSEEKNLIREQGMNKDRSVLFWWKGVMQKFLKEILIREQGMNKAKSGLFWWWKGVMQILFYFF